MDILSKVKYRPILVCDWSGITFGFKNEVFGFYNNSRVDIIYIAILGR